MEKIILDDMIKALKCVASQDTVGDCYADHENFIHMDDEYKHIICGTGEDLRDYISGKEAIGCPYHQNTYGCCFENGELYWLKDVAELLEELKSYKDLEEQGLLIRLPCKVGDTVFFIVGKDISKQRIREMKISDNGLGIIFKAKRRIFNADCVGKDVFLTKEDANQKLNRSKENDIQH